MSPLTLVILAAGLGSRYGGLKQIESVGPAGETIFDYSAFDAARAGFGKLVFVIRKDIEHSFRQIVGARFEKRFSVEYVFQEIDSLPSNIKVPPGRLKPWGTTHAVLTAGNAVHEPFAVINADDFYGASGYRILADHLQSGTSEYAMVGFVLSNTLSDFGAVARGICQVNSHGMLEKIIELTKIERDAVGICNVDPDGTITPLRGDEIVSMNMWGFTPDLFAQFRERFEKFLAANLSNSLAECYLPDTVNALISSGEATVKVLHSTDKWLGVTYRQDRTRVSDGIRRLIDQGNYPESLWA